jgi:Ca2+/Na+ antiporter
MLGLVRLVVMGFVILTVVYVCLSFYSRSVRRSKLKQKWYAGPQVVDRDTFIRRGLEKYDGSIRRKLILGVYIVPVIVVSAIIYLTNFY